MMSIEKNTKYSIFGAGMMGKLAYKAIVQSGGKVSCWIDNSPRLQGTELFGLPILGLKEYIIKKTDDMRMILAFFEQHYIKEVKKQLTEEGVADYEVFDRQLLYRHGQRPRLISYSAFVEMEDVMLYHALHDIRDIFYVDVGCNDPFSGSVTKLLYDMLGAKGINIDALQECVDLCDRERPRDVNLCTAVGDREGEVVISVNGGLTSAVEENKSRSCEQRTVNMTILAKLFDSNLPAGTAIHVLKIDVEGMEEAVLRGNDWARFRPWIVLLESTKPGSHIPTWDQWEKYLVGQGYHFVRMQGVNRYYVADEKSGLDKKLLTMEELMDIYDIWHATLE